MRHGRLTVVVRKHEPRLARALRRMGYRVIETRRRAPRLLPRIPADEAQARILLR